MAGVLALVVSFSSAAEKLPAGVTRVASAEGITEYRLTNGLRVLLGPDESKATATVNITYLVGSRMENYGETGMAHLLEHLLFKGTPTSGNLMEALGKRGMNFNGTTWYDRTNYYESFPAKEANLDWALRMEADRMVNSKIDKKDLDAEMTVVRNEMEMGENEPRNVLIERMMSTAYLWHNYGKSTIGARSDVENVSIERLRAFYRRYYQPDNAVLTLTGKFDTAKALARITQAFGALPRPKRQLDPTYTLDPVQDGERAINLRRVGEVQYLAAMYHVMPGAHPDYPALLVAASALGDVPTGRLHKRLVETQLAADVFAQDYALGEPGVVYFGAQLRPGAPIDKAREVLLDTVEQLAREPITEREVRRAQARMLKGYTQVINDPEKLGVALSEAIAKGDWRLFFLQRDRLRQVSPAVAQRVATAYLKPANRTLGQFQPVAQPDRAPEPQKIDVPALVRDYRGNEAAAAGEAFEATPANIDSRTATGTLGAGLKYALLAKRTRGATVHGSLRLRFGDEQSLFNQVPAGMFVADMLERGTKKRTREELQEAFDELSTEIRVSGSETEVTIDWETVRAGLPKTLELITEMLREPVFAPKEFAQLKEERAAAIERSRGEPDAIAGKALQRHFNRYPRGDVRYIATFEEALEDIGRVSQEQVVAFYRRFYGASFGEISLVGDFDATSTRASLERLLGDWKSTQIYRRVPMPYKEVPARRQQLETPDKANAVALSAIELPVQDNDPAYPALLLGNHLVGGSVQARLPMRIREREGLSYSVSSGFEASRFEPRGELYLYAIHAPQNLERIRQAFEEELERIEREGFKAEEVKADIAAILEERRLNRAQDGLLATQLADNLYSGRGMEFEATIDRQLAAQTAASVSAAWRKFLPSTRFSWAHAGDFAKAAK
ncbi:MAG: insulinase family protein [Betaproteobacteria bacterium]|nr:insulinase family protein [Betaproteobacteria bacterium]